MKHRFSIAIVLAVVCVIAALAGCSSSTTGASSATSASSSASSQSEQSAEASGTATASPSSACPSVNGKLSVKGTSLVDESGNPVQLRGVSTHGLAWFPEYVTKDTFAQVKQWGANVVRLAMYTAESGGYCTGGDRDELLDLIDKGVQYAEELDMYVIIDWHILSDGDPTQYQSQAEEFFNEVTAIYANRNNVLYEICNEPNGGTSWSTVKAYAEDILPIIRANDSDAVVLVGTPNWCQYLGEAAADPITGFDNVMYTLHFYAATHKLDLREVYSSAISAGLPVFVSEYGLCEASGNGSIDTESAAAWVALLNENNTSYCMWSLCNKDESASILNASCSKTSGFTDDDLSAAGKWLVSMLSGSTESVQPQATAESAGDEQGSGELAVSVNCESQWEENGTPVRLYRLSVKNGTSSKVSSWTISATLSAAGSLTDSWNGNALVSGTSLTITPADYNAEVPANGSVADIGFIVKGAQVESATCSAS